MNTRLPRLHPLLLAVLLLSACGGGGSGGSAAPPPAPAVRYFSAAGDSFDFELWKSDGTEAGSRGWNRLIGQLTANPVRISGFFGGRKTREWT